MVADQSYGIAAHACRLKQGHATRIAPSNSRRTDVNHAARRSGPGRAQPRLSRQHAEPWPPPKKPPDGPKHLHGPFASQHLQQPPLQPGPLCNRLSMQQTAPVQSSGILGISATAWSSSSGSHDEADGHDGGRYIQSAELAQRSANYNTSRAYQSTAPQMLPNAAAISPASSQAEAALGTAMDEHGEELSGKVAPQCTNNGKLQVAGCDPSIKNMDGAATGVPLAAAEAALQTGTTGLHASQPDQAAGHSDNASSELTLPGLPGDGQCEQAAAAELPNAGSDIVACHQHDTAEDSIPAAQASPTSPLETHEQRYHMPLPNSRTAHLQPGIALMELEALNVGDPLGQNFQHASQQEMHCSNHHLPGGAQEQQSFLQDSEEQSAQVNDSLLSTNVQQDEEQSSEECGSQLPADEKHISLAENHKITCGLAAAVQADSHSSMRNQDVEGHPASTGTSHKAVTASPADITSVKHGEMPSEKTQGAVKSITSADQAACHDADDGKGAGCQDQLYTRKQIGQDDEKSQSQEHAIAPNLPCVETHDPEEPWHAAVQIAAIDAADCVSDAELLGAGLSPLPAASMLQGQGRSHDGGSRHTEVIVDEALHLKSASGPLQAYLQGSLPRLSSQQKADGRSSDTLWQDQTGCTPQAALPKPAHADSKLQQLSGTGRRQRTVCRFRSWQLFRCAKHRAAADS